MTQRPRFLIGFAVRFGLASALCLIGLGFTAALSVTEDPSPALACPECNDGNGCTVDTCDTVTGTCRHDPMVCVDDGNSCTTERCIAGPFGTGNCVSSPVATGTACNDDDPCTTGDQCASGICVGQASGAGTACNDGDPCTRDEICDIQGHCTGSPLAIGAACDDGDLCTTGEVCAEEEDGSVHCSGTPRACSDGNLCTSDLCDPATGLCSFPPVDCQDGNACTTDTCDPATGACRRDNIPGACSDGNGCTVGDSCQGGNCVPTGPLSCPDLQCARGFCNPFEAPYCHYVLDGSMCPPGGTCTINICTPPGICVSTPISGDCTPPGSCTLMECIRGGCMGVFTIPCNDGNPCTDDTCPNRACSHTTNPDGQACSTGQGACMTAGTCAAGVCAGGQPLNCDDGNPCTTDSCDAAAGCVHTPLTCDDANDCTQDFCSSPSGECRHTPLGGTACNDHNSCTSVDVCVNGQCVGSGTAACDDHNLCTTDLCSPPGGCTYEEVVCDRGNPCEVGLCDHPGIGCQYRPSLESDCDDHNACTINDACVVDATGNGVCRGTSIGVPCDDGNPCTDDVSDQITCQCTHAPNNGACEDGDRCTTGDTCALGSCHPGAPATCDDGNVCTLDACSPATGCGHMVIPAPVICGIGACERTVDTCEGGVLQFCQPGSPGVEICNGIDDDCDGTIDENGLQAFCTPSPATLRLGTGGSPFSMSCTIRNGCGSGGGTTVPPGTLGRAWISRADALRNPADDRTYPDPGTLPCPDPSPGSSSERGISEDLMARKLHGDVATFKFDLPSDGQCETLDGDRQSLMESLSLVPDGEAALVCVAGLHLGDPFEGCATVMVRGGGQGASAPAHKTHRVRQRP